MSTQNSKTIKARVQSKHDVEENWLKATGFVPLAGEQIVYEADATHDKPRIKIGDGKTNVNDLPFIASDLQDHDHGISDVDGLQTELDGIDEEFEEVHDELDDLKNQLADLLYKKIEITSFTNTVGTVEIGSAVDTVTVNWATSKAPKTVMLEGQAIDVSLTRHTFSEANLTSNKTYTLTVTDDRDASASKSTTVYFCNGIYYGVIEHGATVDSDMVLSLTRKLQGSKSTTFTANAGENQHIAFIMPARYGTPTFNVSGFDGGFTLTDTISFTNASGYTEDYAIYLSDNVELGDTTVKVS
jgi:hypothetical protein